MVSLSAVSFIKLQNTPGAPARKVLEGRRVAGDMGRGRVWAWASCAFAAVVVCWPRAEVCYNGFWGTVCSSSTYNNANARVVCRWAAGSKGEEGVRYTQRDGMERGAWRQQTTQADPGGMCVFGGKARLHVVQQYG
jgi:hypothetical protein